MSQRAPIVLTAVPDHELCELIGLKARNWGYDCRTARTPTELEQALAACVPDAVVLDAALLPAAQPLYQADPDDPLSDIPILLLTEPGSGHEAFHSRRGGAYDCLPKPIDWDRLHVEIEKAVERHRLRVRVRELEDRNRPAPDVAKPTSHTVEEMTRELIHRTLQATAGSVPVAAKLLGISEATIYRKLKRFNLPCPRRPSAALAVPSCPV